MDPNLFHLDWERTFEVVAAIVVLAFFVERALALIFENEAYLQRFGDSPIKEIIVFGVSVAICLTWKFDAISTIVLKEQTTLPGELITAGVIAGGSKGSIKLFRDVLGFKSGAYADYEKAKKAESPARVKRFEKSIAASRQTPPAP